MNDELSRTDSAFIIHHSTLIVPPMSLAIIVPVKSLDQAKSRLASVLPGDKRRSLSLSLLRNVLSVVQQAQARLPAYGIVISPDPTVLGLAAYYGLSALRDRTSLPAPDPSSATSPLSSSGLSARRQVTSTIASPRTTAFPLVEAALNDALEQATAYAITKGAKAVLILPADLPLLTLKDVEELWQASQQLVSMQAMVIAPDSREQGTNALLVRPPGAITYEFGPGSFQRHQEQARELGLALHVRRSPRLGLDVDLPADLEQYLAVEQADPAKEQAMEASVPPRSMSAALEAFLLRPNLLMRLGTLGQNGYPHVTPVWFLYEEGLFYITTASDRIKARNMLVDSRVGFAVDNDQQPYQGLTVWGNAELVAEGEAARSITGRIAARYVPEEHLEATVDTLMQAPRVVFAIRPLHLARMGTWED